VVNRRRLGMGLNLSKLNGGDMSGLHEVSFDNLLCEAEVSAHRQQVFSNQFLVDPIV